jgi:hypothetical protein
MKKIISNVVLIGTLFFSCSSFAETMLPLIEVNEGQAEILSTKDLPPTIQEEIKIIAKAKKPSAKLVNHEADLLKYFQIGKKVSVLGFDGKILKSVKLIKIEIEYKQQGDCTNYPDVFLKVSTDGNLNDISGIMLPESASVITDSKKVTKLSSIVSKGLSQVLGKDLSEQIPDFVSSSSYFTYDGKTYAISPGIGEGGHLGVIANGKYIKIGDLQLLMCGS